MVGGALRNVYRPQRGLAGLVSVGDTVATTTPTRGRGVAMAFLQVDALLRLLDDGADAGTVAEPFGAWCDELIRPWVEDHLAIDSEAVARWQGAPLDLTRPLSTERICEAAQADPRISDHTGPYFARPPYRAAWSRQSRWPERSTRRVGGAVRRGAEPRSARRPGATRPSRPLNPAQPCRTLTRRSAA